MYCIIAKMALQKLTKGAVQREMYSDRFIFTFFICNSQICVDQHVLHFAFQNDLC